MLALPLLVLVYAIPGFAIGAGVAHLIQHGIAHVHVHQVSLSDAVVQSLWTGSVSQKVVGLFASFVFARRVGRGVYDDIQLFFAERRRAAGKPLRFYHRLVPTFEARYNSVSAEEAASPQAASTSAGPPGFSSRRSRSGSGSRPSATTCSPTSPLGRSDDLRQPQDRNAGTTFGRDGLPRARRASARRGPPPPNTLMVPLEEPARRVLRQRGNRTAWRPTATGAAPCCWRSLCRVPAHGGSPFGRSGLGEGESGC